MTRLLVVETSPRGENSISRNLTRRYVARWQDAHPEGEVVIRDLMETDLPFVTAPWLHAYFTPSEQHTPEMKEVLSLSDELVAELLAADHVVIATVIAAGGAKAVDLGEVTREAFLQRFDPEIDRAPA